MNRGDLLGNRELVIGAHLNTRLVEILVQRDFLREEDVHDVALLVKAHSLDLEQVWRIQIVQLCGLSEDIVDDLVLDAFEVDNAGDQRECWLILLVKRLDLEERSKGVLLLALVELFVQTELFLAGKDAVRERE